MNPISYRTVLVDGLTVFYREAGEKQAHTLVLLHGFPCGRSTSGALSRRSWPCGASMIPSLDRPGPRDAQRGKLKQSEKKQSESRCCMVKKPREASAIGVH